MSGEADAGAQYGSLSANASAFSRSVPLEITGFSSASASAAFEDIFTVVGSGPGFVRAALVFSISYVDGAADTSFQMAGYIAPSVPGGLDGGAFIEVDIPIEFGCRLRSARL
jgi:hypothetical protein